MCVVQLPSCEMMKLTNFCFKSEDLSQTNQGELTSEYESSEEEEQEEEEDLSSEDHIQEISDDSGLERESIEPLAEGQSKFN